SQTREQNLIATYVNYGSPNRLDRNFQYFFQISKQKENSFLITEKNLETSHFFNVISTLATFCDSNTKNQTISIIDDKKKNKND
ncbi:hypothetical protein BpHYR1_004746, partial [Brachionus plicatilis]